MNWAQPQQPFRFGPLSAVQQGLYEDKPDLAYQQLMDYWGQGQAGFQNTVLGRYLASQQPNMFNRFTAQQAANPTGGLTWTNYLENQSAGTPKDFALLPAYMRGSNPAAMRVRRELW